MPNHDEKVAIPFCLTYLQPKKLRLVAPNVWVDDLDLVYLAELFCKINFSKKMLTRGDVSAFVLQFINVFFEGKAILPDIKSLLFNIWLDHYGQPVSVFFIDIFKRE